jgi:chlorophyll synthase
MRAASLEGAPRPAEPIAGVGPSQPPSLGEFIFYLWRLSRPEAWMVSLLPMYVGFVLASRTIFPGFASWSAFWADASVDGATSSEFIATLVAWLGEAWRFLVACVVMGPLAWLATLLINDVHDLPGDRGNPRKARSPLVQGLVSAGRAQVAAYCAAAGALALAILLSWQFALLTLGCLALAWAYSAPPVRLKTRPGADLLVNALGVGVLAALAGWTLAAPLGDAPWPFLPQGLLVAAAVYIPTTLVDFEADRAAGYATFATRLGRERAYRVGMACWTAANAGALALSVWDVFIPRAMLPILVIFCPLLLYEYHALIGKARDGPAMVQGVILCSLTFLAVNLVFALMYTGLWRI